MFSMREAHAEMKRRFPNISFDIVFDVGANTGQSAKEFVVTFPKAAVHSFEPIRATFDKLAEATANLDRVVSHYCGLTDIRREGKMLSVGTSVSNMVVDDKTDGESTELVQLLRGDEFCQENSVDRINYLKIDTEGHDLAVLHGFDTMLRKLRVDFVEAEVSLNHRNPKHVPLEQVKSYLEERNYHIFCIAEQAFERADRNHLRRGNVIFVSEFAVHTNVDSSAKPHPWYPEAAPVLG